MGRLQGAASGYSWSEIERIKEHGNSNGQSFVEKWHIQGDDMGNWNVHEESLPVSLHWLVSKNFEDKIFIRG